MKAVLPGQATDRLAIRLRRAEESFLDHTLVRVVAVLAITSIAFALRLYRADSWGLWSDEIYTLRDTFQRDRFGLTFAAIRLLTNYFGHTAFVYRIPAIVLGTATIPILYSLIKRVFDPVIALIAVSLVAVSPWHVYWSQNARFYVSIFLFYNLALFAFYHAVEKRQIRWGMMALCGLLLTVAVVDRIMSLIFLPVVLSFLIVRQSLDARYALSKKQMALIVLFGVVGFGVVTVFHQHQVISFFEKFWGYPIYHPVILIGRVGYWIGIPLGVVGVAATRYLWRKHDQRYLLIIMAAWVPILVLALMSPFVLAFPRYAFVALLGWVLLAATAVRELFSHSSPQIYWLILGVVGILVIEPMSQDFLYYFAEAGYRPAWREAYETISQDLTDDDLVITGWPEVGNYYLPDTQVEWFTDVDMVRNRIDETGMARPIWIIEGVAPLTQDWSDWAYEHCHIKAIHDRHRLMQTSMMRVFYCDPGER